MSDFVIKCECLLDRSQESVTLVIYDIPMDLLEKTLRDMGTKDFRTNVIDGVRAQWVAGGPQMMTSVREFHADADKEVGAEDERK